MLVFKDDRLIQCWMNPSKADGMVFVISVEDAGRRVRVSNFATKSTSQGTLLSNRASRQYLTRITQMDSEQYYEDKNGSRIPLRCSSN